MISAVSWRRRTWDRLCRGLIILAGLLSLMPLISVLVYVTVKGVSSMRPSFFVQLPQPIGMPGGGMANAIVGTLMLVGIASLIAVPFGILVGIYLSEYGRGRFAHAVRLLSDTMAGIPSITAGLFAYTLIVRASGHFSAIAGSVALTLLMLPLVIRATEQGLLAVPRELREGSLALGVSRWRTIVSVVLPTASASIITGCLLAVARASGETAPLLFTAFGSPFLVTDPTKPIEALPLQIYVYATAPYTVNKRLAWAGALTLVALVLLLNIVARTVSARSRH